MGLLDNLKCEICGKKFLLSGYRLHKKTYICSSCLKKAGGLANLHLIHKMTTQEITNKIKLNSQNNSNVDHNDTSFYYDYDTFDIYEKYKSIIDKHFNNLEKIGMLYTVANNLSLPNSPEMQKVIDLCIEDIKLAPIYMKYCIEEANYYHQDLSEHVPNYVTFYRLAIIYEKQKEYQKAIDVCNYAIKLGYIKDGTSGQMPGRVARLIKKARQQNLQIDETQIIDINNI